MKGTTWVVYPEEKDLAKSEALPKKLNLLVCGETHSADERYVSYIGVTQVVSMTLN